MKRIFSMTILIVASGLFLACGASSEKVMRSPPINFEFKNTQVVSEIRTGSVAIQNDTFVAPDGYTVLYGSGIPPKVAPTSGKLLIAFGNLTVKSQTPRLEAIELMRGTTSLSTIEGIVEPKAGSELVFRIAKAQELNPGLEKLNQDNNPLEIGFVFRINETNFNAADAALRISWRTEADKINSMIIPLQMK